jgi:hypothetical protein
LIGGAESVAACRRLDAQREHAWQMQPEHRLVGVVVTDVEHVLAARMLDQSA